MSFRDEKEGFGIPLFGCDGRREYGGSIVMTSCLGETHSLLKRPMHSVKIGAHNCMLGLCSEESFRVSLPTLLILQLFNLTLFLSTHIRLKHY